MPLVRRISPFLTQRLRELDDALAASIPRVTGSTDDEAIHDLRVAIRRLRTLLKLARPVYGRFHADAVRGAFTAVQRATGDLRDEEVLDETLDDAHVDHPTFVVWRERRGARERRLRRSVILRLKTGELARARQMLRALLALPVRPKRDRDLGKFARKCVERARRGVDAQRDVGLDDVDGLHELRIAYKELRYASELLEAALPADLAALASPAARFQKLLGEIHDADVALATARRARALAPEARDALLARLGKLREKRVAKYAAEMNIAVAPEPVNGVTANGASALTPSAAARS